MASVSDRNLYHRLGDRKKSFGCLSHVSSSPFHASALEEHRYGSELLPLVRKSCNTNHEHFPQRIDRYQLIGQFVSRCTLGKALDQSLVHIGLRQNVPRLRLDLVKKCHATAPEAKFDPRRKASLNKARRPPRGLSR